MKKDNNIKSMAAVSSAEIPFSSPNAQSLRTGSAFQRRRISEPLLKPFTSLAEVLEDHSFIDYGTLNAYKDTARSGRDTFANTGATLIKKIRIDNHPLPPTMQADLLVRYVMHQATLVGENPIDYITRIYHIPHMTWQLAQGGYTESSIKQRAWKNLLERDEERERKVTGASRRLHIAS